MLCCQPSTLLWTKTLNTYSWKLSSVLDKKGKYMYSSHTPLALVFQGSQAIQELQVFPKKEEKTT